MVRQLIRRHKHRSKVWNFRRIIPEITILYKNSFSIFQLHVFSSSCPWICLETLTPECFLELSAACFDFFVSDFITFLTHHFLWIRFWLALYVMNWCATGVLLIHFLILMRIVSWNTGYRLVAQFERH